MGGFTNRFTPLEPSSLRVLSGPVSPASPTTPHRPRFLLPTLPSPNVSRFGTNTLIRTIPLSLKPGVPAPPDTMPWIWSCHKCHTRYPLGVTRRCLHDGHFFCGGTTVDRHTGKLKKHRACASEFDYLGWEDFGAWKRRVAARHSLIDKLTEKPPGRHCERYCAFPSACHWKAKHAPRKEATFYQILDEKTANKETSKAVMIPETQDTPLLSRKTGFYLNRLVKAAEKRTTQFSTLLSTIEDESNFASTPGFIPASTDTAPKLPELNLNFPIMDFSAMNHGLDDYHKESQDLPPAIFEPEIIPPPISAPIETVTEETRDVTMTDWIPEDPATAPGSTNLILEAESASFDFRIDTNTSLSPSSSPTEASSPTSEKSMWEYTSSDIGLALGSPNAQSVHDKIWDEQMDEVEGLWDKAICEKSNRG